MDNKRLLNGQLEVTNKNDAHPPIAIIGPKPTSSD